MPEQSSEEGPSSPHPSQARGGARKGADDAGILPPLIVTLLLEETAQERFDRLRDEHFPPERNYVAAHVTLFHALPGEHLDAVRADLSDATDRPSFDVAVTGVRFLGRGVAYTLESAEVAALRSRLVSAWQPWLTPQDRQRHSPHVTVQNKVQPAVARALHERLLAEFVPWPVRARGLGLWRYLGGPWEPVAELPFR